MGSTSIVRKYKLVRVMKYCLGVTNRESLLHYKWPERVGDGHKSLQVDACQVPDDEGVDQVDNEAADLTHGEARHGAAGQDGGGGEEEECEAQHGVGEAKVDQQQAAGLPGLVNKNSFDYHLLCKMNQKCKNVCVSFNPLT